MKARFNAMPKGLRIALISVLAAAVLLGVVVGVLKLLSSASSEKVSVYPVDYFQAYGSSTQSETQGQVTLDNIQTVYVTSTQQITEIYVKEGDTVHAGDPLLAFDTTLSDLEVERQALKVEQLKLDLQNALTNLATVNTYRVASYDTTDTTPSVLTPVSVPYFRAGSGTYDDPYRVVWDMDTCYYSQDFINSILPEAVDPEDPEAEEPEQPSVYVTFEVRDGDSLQGDILNEWEIGFFRTADGGYEFVMIEPEIEIIDDDDDDDTSYLTPTYDWADLVTLKMDAQKKVTDLQLELKKAELQYDTLNYELNNGIVTAKIDGVVKSVLDYDTAVEENQPLIRVSGGGGYYVTGVLSELELSSMHVGDTVSVMSWETYCTMDGTITAISEYPTTDSNTTYYSSGNSNVSYYPFTVFISEDNDLREGETVDITYTPGGDPGYIYLSNVFIRSENGRSYVYAENASGRLEKRWLETGISLWGSYTEVRGGLSLDDYVAFPYGNSIKEGARTEEHTGDEFYSAVG